MAGGGGGAEMSGREWGTGGGRGGGCAYRLMFLKGMEEGVGYERACEVRAAGQRGRLPAGVVKRESVGKEQRAGRNESGSSGAGAETLKGFGVSDTGPECAASGDKIAGVKASKQGAQFFPPSPPPPVILLFLQLRCSEIAATMKCSCGGCSVRNSEPLRPREAACWRVNAIGHKAFCNGRCHCGGLSQKIRVENGTESPVVQQLFLNAVEIFHLRLKFFHIAPNVQKLNCK